MQEWNTVTTYALWAVMGVAVLSIAYALFMYRRVVSQDKGTSRMQEVWDTLRSGTSAYLEQQLRIIVPLVIVLAVLAGASVLVIAPTPDVIDRVGAEQALFWVAGGRAVALLLGAVCAYVAASVGMRAAIHASVRMAASARKGYAPALKVAAAASNVTGMLTMGLVLLSSALIFYLLGFTATDELISLSAGVLLVALLLHTAGGVVAYAANTGAELVRKIEMGMPDDDLQNVAVIADRVGAHAVESAGASLDLGVGLGLSLVAALILGLAMGSAEEGAELDLHFMLFPVLVTGIGLAAALIGSLFVQTDERRRNARAAINRGFYSAVVLTVVGMAAVTYYMPHRSDNGVVDWRPFMAAATGVALAVVLSRVTDYFTATTYGRVKEVGRFSRTGSSTSMLSGLMVGLDASFWVMLVLALALASPLMIYGGADAISVLYGISLVGTGLLALSGTMMATRQLAPVASSARWIGRMAGVDKNARNVMEDMDAVGHLTRSTTAGYALGVSLLSAVALLGAAFVNVGQVQAFLGYAVLDQINLAVPVVLISLLVGGAVTLITLTLTINAVLRVMAVVVDAARRQYRRATAQEGATSMDYAQAMGVATTAAQRELISIALPALLVPVVIGFLLGVEALSALIIGLILVGVLVAIFLVNAGGSVRSARRYIEDGNFGGKHSEAHKAALISEAMGMPLAGSAEVVLNPLIKAVSLAGLVLAPVLVVVRVPGEPIDLAIWIGAAVCCVILLWAFWQSRRETAQLAELAKAAGAQGRI